MRSLSLRGRLPAGSGLLLVPAAALAVHQLRFWLTYGAHANAELAAQGHSYLNSLVPWLVLGLGVGLSLFLRRVGRALRTGDAGRFGRCSAVAVWLLAWAGLVTIFAAQESLEELFASGHPSGVAGVFGHGGWWALPAAALVAALVTALLRTARAVLRFAAALHPRVLGRAGTLLRPAAATLVVPASLAPAPTGRGPPFRLLVR